METLTVCTFVRNLARRGEEWYVKVCTSCSGELLCCLLLQDLVDSCAREGEEDIGGHVLWDTTSRGMCE
jgi:hypothetical protein